MMKFDEIFDEISEDEHKEFQNELDNISNLFNAFLDELERVHKAFLVTIDIAMHKDVDDINSINETTKVIYQMYMVQREKMNEELQNLQDRRERINETLQKCRDALNKSK